MAMLKLTDGTKMNLSPEKALHLWQVLRGDAEPANEKVEQIAMRVDKIYLNWRNAPDEYLLERKEVLIPMVINCWMFNTETREPTRPEFSDRINWRVSYFYKLLDNNRPTALARQYFDKKQVTDDRYHPGIAQSSYDAIPVNDR